MKDKTNILLLLLFAGFIGAAIYGAEQHNRMVRRAQKECEAHGGVVHPFEDEEGRYICLTPESRLLYSDK